MRNFDFCCMQLVFLQLVFLVILHLTVGNTTFLVILHLTVVLGQMKYGNTTSDSCFWTDETW